MIRLPEVDTNMDIIAGLLQGDKKIYHLLSPVTGIPYYPNLQEWILNLTWFSVISKIHTLGSFTLFREVGVFYSPSQMGHQRLIWFKKAQ